MNPMQRLARIAVLTGIVLLAFGIFHLVLGVWVWPITTRDIFRLVFLGLNLVGGLALLVLGLVFNIEGVKALTTRRSALYSTNAIAYSAIAIGVLAALNWVGYRHHHEFDLTAEKVFTLSDQSRKILENLKADLVIHAFTEIASEDKAKDLLEPYRRASGRVRIEYLDPNRNPQLAKDLGVTHVPEIHIQSGSEKVSVSELTEQEITNGLIKVTRQGKKTVCFVEGHGEPDTESSETRFVGEGGYDAFRKALVDENYETKKILLATLGDVPGECTILVEAGPKTALLPSEVDAIGRFLDRGGKALIMPAPEYDGATRSVQRTGLEDLLQKWGVEVGGDIVLDQVMRLFAGPSVGLEPLARSYGFHAITKDFRTPTLYPFVRTVEPKTGGPAGLTATTLVRTGDSSWAETRLPLIFEPDEEARIEIGDQRRGPLSIAVAVSRKVEGKKKDEGATSESEAEAQEEAESDAGGEEGGDDSADEDGEEEAEPGSEEEEDDDDEGKTAAPKSVETRLVVVGSSAWLGNQAMMGGFGGNRDLALNVMGWLGGEEDLISIRPRKMKASRIALTPAQRTKVFTLSFLLYPEVLVVAGLVIWWRRR